MMLKELHCAANAYYWHSGSRACLDGTRESVLGQIDCWVKDHKSPPIFWLNGFAGTGNTSIARTIAEKISKDGRSWASFFCSRDPNDPDRGEAKLIIPTLAYQLALKHSKFLLGLKEEAISNVPQYSPEGQIIRLIIRPLQKSGIPNQVFVIDGLDACQDNETVSKILSALAQYAGEIRKLRLKFLITSRPETRIHECFLPAISQNDVTTFSLHEVGRSEVNEDIRQFFKHELVKPNCSQVKMDDWPGTRNLDLLCQRTAGLFFYAVEAVKSINLHFAMSRGQLDLRQLLDNISLDSLYTPIIGSASDGSCYDDPNIPRSILGAVALAPSPITPSTVAKLSCVELRTVLYYLQRFEALFIFGKDDDSPIQPVHKSISTFLTDPSKSDQWFYICPRTHHKNCCIACLKLIREQEGGGNFPVGHHAWGKK